MSAYMVDRKHVRYLVEAALQLRVRWYWSERSHSIEHDVEAAGRLGQMLWDANRESINARYPDCVGSDDLPGPIGETYLYGRHRLATRTTRDPLQVIMSCRCFAYQACEYDGWETSQAKRFIDALEHWAVDKIEGFDDRVWGAPDLGDEGISVLAIADRLR